MIKNILKRYWYSMFGRHPYAYIGRMIRPFVKRNIRQNIERNFFITNYAQKNKADLLTKIVTADIVSTYYALTESERKKINNEHFWGGEAGKAWHEKKNEMVTNEMYRSWYQTLLSQISEVLSSNPRLKTLCEIGTGNGNLLDIISKREQGVERFIGIDINKSQISENIKTYLNSRMEFVCSDVTDYLNKLGGSNLVLVSAGTLMYFSESEIIYLLNMIKIKFKEAAIIIREPTDNHFDDVLLSKHSGHIDYHHNYLKIFKKMDYSILCNKMSYDDSGQPTLTLTAIYTAFK